MLPPAAERSETAVVACGCRTLAALSPCPSRCAPRGVVMLEGVADQLSEEVVVAAVAFADPHCQATALKRGLRFGQRFGKRNESSGTV